MQVGTEELGDKVDVLERGNEDVGERDDVFVLDVLQELELSVGALGEDGCACERARGSWVSHLRRPVFLQENELTERLHANGEIVRKEPCRWSATSRGER